jgi:hypothetical protein
MPVRTSLAPSSPTALAVRMIERARAAGFVVEKDAGGIEPEVKVGERMEDDLERGDLPAEDLLLGA